MNFLFGMSWKAQAITAMFCSVPMVFAAEYFRSNFDMRFEGILFTYLSGIISGLFLMARFNIGGVSVKGLCQPFWPLVIIFFLGLVFGSTGHSMLVSAMLNQNVPSAALPYAIFGLNPSVAYTLTVVGAICLPQAFKNTQPNWVNFCGLLTLAAGTAMVMYKNH